MGGPHCLMIRSATPADTDQLVALARGTGVFQPHEIVALREVLDDYHAANEAEGHVARVFADAAGVAGFTYFAPVPMTDRTWELWWIAVDRSRQGGGLGRILIEDVEADLRAHGQRLLLIDTSSLPHYEPTRRFYLNSGYSQAARVPDFYRDGDDKVLFWKKL
jgi:ribosomal protein S18 acetylase RimI-like enzyme